jgi:hypothetical protein
MVARWLFFLLAAIFCLTASIPLRSSFSDDWTSLSFVIASTDAHPGIYFRPQSDWPTGDLVMDVPLWAVDLGLFLLTSVAFVGYSRQRLRDQARCQTFSRNNSTQPAINADIHA